MSFGSPYLLLCLLAVPLALVGYRVLEGRRARRAAAWTSRSLLPNMILGGRPGRRRYVGFAIFLLGLTFLLVGFARPQHVAHAPQPNPPTVVFAIDVSGSMAATDVRPTRVGAARLEAIRALGAVPAGDQVAVVSFGDKARLIVPPTLDRKTVIAGLPKSVTPRAGTAIGDGVSDAVAVIGQANGSNASLRPGVVVVLSDGAQTAGGSTLTQAGLTARVQRIPVDTIPIGTQNGVVTQLVKLNVGSRIEQFHVPVQPEALQALSVQTGGFSSASPSSEQLQQAFAGLGTGNLSTRTIHELSAAAGGIGFLLIAAGILVSGVWFGRLA
jgi:Ca-activated chloride channel homolog